MTKTSKNVKCPICGRFVSKTNLERYEEERNRTMQNPVNLISENRAKKRECETLKDHVRELQEKLRVVETQLWDERHKSIWSRIFGK